MFRSKYLCSIGGHIMAAVFLLHNPAIAWGDIYEKIDINGIIAYSDSPLDDQYVLIIQENIGSDKNINIEHQLIHNLSNAISPTLNTRISTPAELLQHIETASNTHQVDPDLIHAVMHIESAYRQHAKSVKGAVGLMQLMPETAKRMGVNDIYNSAQNIEGGAKYLRQLLKLFDNDTRLALAAYNAGENSVLKYGKKIPPFKETQAYVLKVMRVYEALKKQRAKI